MSCKKETAAISTLPRLQTRGSACSHQRAHHVVHPLCNHLKCDISDANDKGQHTVSCCCSATMSSLPPPQSSCHCCCCCCGCHCHSCRVVLSLSLRLLCHGHCLCRCRHDAIIIAAAAAVAVVVAVAAMVVVIAHRHCIVVMGRTMVGMATSLSSRRLKARRAWGAVKGGYKQQQKILAHTPVHTRPRDSAMLSSCCSRHCHWSVAGPWRKRTGTSISKEGQGWEGTVSCSVRLQMKKKR